MLHEAYNHIITFESTLPELSLLIEQATKRAETSIGYAKEEHSICCETDNCWIYFLPEENSIHLEGRQRYILSVLLLILIELGGQYKGHIPHYAKWPWHRVKDNLAKLPPYDAVPTWLEYEIMGEG